MNKIEKFVKSPYAALRCILRHCGVPISTPHSSGFARLASGAFYEFLIARLMKLYATGSFLLVLSVMCAACSSSQPELDKTKFNGVTAAAQSVRSTLESGAGYQAFGSSLQQLSAEITALKIGALTDQEKELIKDYSNLYSIYHDGYILWKYKIEFTRYGFVPKELIYAGQDIEPIIEKYRIPVEFHVYVPTQQSWKSIPASSLQMIWTNADSQIQIINNILSYR